MIVIQSRSLQLFAHIKSNQFFRRTLFIWKSDSCSICINFFELVHFTISKLIFSFPLFICTPQIETSKWQNFEFFVKSMFHRLFLRQRRKIMNNFLRKSCSQCFDLQLRRKKMWFFCLVYPRSVIHKSSVKKHTLLSKKYFVSEAFIYQAYLYIFTFQLQLEHVHILNCTKF